HEEQIESFNHWFHRERGFIKEASLLILKDNEVAAFIVSRSQNDDTSIGPVGVTTGYRRKGLGKVLLSRAITAIRGKGIQRISLEMDSSNIPALELYKKYGFRTIHETVYYAWTPGGKE
ncbi:MAG: GNAT family N-acetyltransferase, partial [Candidatus Thorarchaeota archaeon]